MAVIFITHDMGVIAEICDDVVVMYAGMVAENANVYELFQNPCHPYTQGLLASIPHIETKPKTLLPVIEGTVPSLFELPNGCRFQNRCPHVMSVCSEKPPPIIEAAEEHRVSCYLFDEKLKNLRA
jgi:peptide/nickel transport system ATP-binding protein